MLASGGNAANRDKVKSHGSEVTDDAKEVNGQSIEGQKEEIGFI